MTAGRQNTLSRTRYSNHSEEENLSYRNRTFVSGLSHRKTQHPISSCGRPHIQRRNGYVDLDLSRSVQPFDLELQDRNEEVVSENGSMSKKRKFSPIVWDRVEKQDFLTRSPPPKLSKDIVGDLRIKRCSVAADSDLQISSVESLVSNVSDGVTGTPQEHDQEIEYVEVEEERNLAKSKWAFKYSPRMASDVNNSSPESGEFKQCEGNDEVSSLSSEDEQPESVADKCYLSSDDDNDDHGSATEAPELSRLGMMPCCRNVFEYERLGKISEGTYGVVYKARDKETGEIVALKKVKMGKEREGFPVTALREINILGSFQHPSIVEVKEVVTDDFDGVYMVMEFVDHELKGYMDRMKQPFSQSEVKCLMVQLLEGLSYLHDNWVIHRDLKTSNLLLNKNGELKICDFGMSRQYGSSPVKPYTSLVVTLWYRAPEVLLGMKNYSTAIDMWSVGCIMAELLSKKPLFDGSRELEQIDKIFRTLGTPNDLIWPGYSSLPGVKPNFVKQPYNTLRKRFPVATFTGSPALTELGFDLLNKLLTYDPKKRITAEEALNHGWFRESPLPAENVRICK